MSTRNNTKLSRLAANECLNFNLRKADRAISQSYDKAISASGVKGTQFSLLNGISLAGGASISSIAEAMVMDRTTMTRNLALLERDGLIKISAGRDRRTRSVEITPAGSAVLEQALPLWHAENQRLKKNLGVAAATRLVEQLKAVVTAAGK